MARDVEPGGADTSPILNPLQINDMSTPATAQPEAAEHQERPIAIDSIPTPFVRVDPAIVAANVRRMAEYARQHSLNLRPHAKTHKSLRAAALQLAAGACGLTVAKPSEAEVMAKVCQDLLVAYPIVTTDKARRLAALVAQGTKISVATDSRPSVMLLAREAMAAGVRFDLLVDVNLGFGRTGVAETVSVLQLARLIEATEGVDFAGLFFFPGELMGPPAEQSEGIRRQAERLVELREQLRADGVEVRVVSGGSTPTAGQSHLNSLLTEIRPGTYIYNDRMCVTGGHASFDQCAARVVATVVSTTVDGQVVIDAGSKVLTSDGAVHVEGFGHVVEYPAAVVRKLSEEHGMIDIRNCHTAPEVGQRLTLIPNHICPCINLTDVTYWVDGDEAIPVPVDARGCVW